MRPRPTSDETGIALITTLLVLMMVSALMVGFFATIAADQRASGIDRDQTQAYAAAHAGLEKMTSDLATLFATDVSPTVLQINNVALVPPTIDNFVFTAPDGGSGYTLTFTPDANGNPAPKDILGSNITSGPYQGFKGIVTEYPITVTARSDTPKADKSEVRLRRVLNTIAVPVFQFGVFSENDLTFFSGESFDFGGRVHTNGNLFASVLSGQILTFRDRITAVSQVARAVFSNGLSTTTNTFTGVVRVPLDIVAGTFRDLQENEGSVTGMPGVGQTLYGPWFNLSTGPYASNIRNGLTGAKKLDLPLVSQGAVPIDLIRRPVQGSNEHTANQPVYLQRLFAQASLRILLSDTAADITSLPTVTATAPVQLDGDWYTTPPNNGTAYGAIGTARPPIARSPGTAANQLNGSLSAGAGTVTVDATAQFLPVLTVTSNVGVLTTVYCTGKTIASPWRFTGCTGVPAVPATLVGAAVTSGPGVSTTLSVANAAASTTLTVANAAALAPFVPLPFWIGTNLVTCTGYTSTTFTGCINTPAASDNTAVSTRSLSNAGVGLIGGFLKIERQAAPIPPAVMGVWTDVTMEFLNYGMGGPNLQAGANYTGNGICADPTPAALIRLQRLRNNPAATTASCTTGTTYANTATPKATDYWPNVLYDTREGTYRDVASTAPMTIGGVMHYVELDVANLATWFARTAPHAAGTGNQAWNNNGYIVYFSDRRSNRNAANVETGEYGFEDVVNPLSATGAQNGTLQVGEDMNGNDVLDRYGETPPVAYNAPYDANARPWTTVTVPQAAVNRSILFRRALKLTRGGIGIVTANQNPLPTSGLTVASENPVYVHGNYNATTSATAEPNRPASIMADAVTLLSTAWNDMRSLRNPSLSTDRDAATTGYRFAVISGKGLSFPWPAAGTPQFLFGTDGGAGNFLRLLEDWNTSGAVINYRGSIISLFISRQATGTFKYTNSRSVYFYSDRAFSFDTDFLIPALLPPGTPMFRDVNTLTFRQLLRPTQ